MKRLAVALSLLLLAAAPRPLWACACGCGVFEAATTSMLATHVGGMAYLRWDYLNQNQNWSRYSKSPAENNPDKHLETSFFTFGTQYFFKDDWGLMAEAPVVHRYFKTSADDVNAGEFKHAAIGDMRFKGVYTGLSSDKSTGLTVGLKLPTGDDTYPNFDRDTQIGSGSTDLLLGGYHAGRLSPLSRWSWFANGELDEPALVSGGYRPGAEFNAALGGYWDPFRFGELTAAPLAQAIYTHRWRDRGTLADAPDTGYDRITLGPGFELGWRSFRLYGNVAFPVYQYVNGQQLVAPRLYSLTYGLLF